VYLTMRSSEKTPLGQPSKGPSHQRYLGYLIARGKKSSLMSLLMCFRVYCMFLVSLESSGRGGVHGLGSMTFGLAVQIQGIESQAFVLCHWD
jgi:hypothetical protein